MTDTVRSPSVPDTIGSRRRSAWSAAAGSVAAAVALWVVAVPLAGVDLVVDTGGTSTEVSPVSVVLGSLVGGLGAVGIGWAVRRWSSRPRRHFLVVTGLVAFLSLFSPTAAAESVSTAWWLCSMHVAVAAVAMFVVAHGLPNHAHAGEERE